MVVGEKYTVSFWVKLVDYTLPGNFELWFNNGDWNSGKLRNPVDWEGGVRSTTVLNTSTMRDYKEEWIEVKFDFTALGKFIGIGVPGLTECYIDDARITLSSADESYVRTTEGKGKKFEDWYSQSDSDGDKYVPIEEKDEPIIIRYAVLEGLDADINAENGDNSVSNDTNYQDTDKTENSGDSSGNKQSGGKKTVRVKMKKKKTQTGTENSSAFPIWLIVIAGVSVLVVAAGVVSAVVITKKRKSSSK